MFCPKCKGDTKVCDTRQDKEANEIFRRRVCEECGDIFFTIEFDVENNDKFVERWKTLQRGAGPAKSKDCDNKK